MHFKLLAALSTWSMVSGVLGDAMLPRILQQCVLMNRQQRIICHGGTTAGTDVWNHFSPTADFFQLNVSTPLSPSDAATGWTPMPSVPDFALEARAEFGMTQGIFLTGRRSGFH
ncbi:hypothetical protein BC940DRAFT_126718 [Gongronella butleri]|nr:hypothetical protein BC940DRAFT_126718 [Gongronella butleri]